MSDNEMETTTTSEQQIRLPLLPFAQPLVTSEKDVSKLFKVISKAVQSKEKNVLHRGIKNVNRAIRKKTKGFVVLAGDSYPMDIISHFPELIKATEGVEFVFVESKVELGKATLTKRPACAIMVAEPPKESKLHKYYKKANKVVSSAQQQE
ncbi:hypothetical protein C9374_007113 [Naegleria lovaniensis]|uniref:Ribosomal protein eL8/eL30/eS12/Gadd45 domain-containing protein n=1 Tax=Naegleria lovaniensis TaxID=51637 RepID=A0AA88H6S3_NAELO|nr:uncharacterized protein C9374_007113 [Naegleria lovaniensis]KAG2393582.1 hypothetical protein C9374_007113 [Naegleria lovaniensis]